MRKKVYRYILAIVIIAISLAMVLSYVVFLRSMKLQAESDVKRTTSILRAGFEKDEDIEFLRESSSDDYRITLIKSTGEVVFESVPKGKSYNHLNRPEVKEAMKNGVGSELRVSQTLDTLTYYYAIELNNGEILRVALDMESVKNYSRETAIILLLIYTLVILLALAITRKLTDNVVQPIEEMGENLENIDAYVPYSELVPFAESVKRQQVARQEAEDFRRHFTANVSHELKTPLTSISGYAEMIENGMAKEVDIKKFANKIRLEATRLLSLIGDIIDLSKLDSMFNKDDFKTVDLYNLVLNTLDILDYSYKEKEISLKVEGENVLVKGSYDQLEEMCYNLIDNSIKYTEPKGEILVEIGGTDGVPFLKVSDTGIGISEKDQKRIFERFFRVDKSRSKKLGGTGLGLAIVKHIVLHHEGEIDVKSTLGTGTEMTVRFPKYEN